MIKLWTLLPGGSPNIYLPSSLLVVRRRWLWWGLRYTKGSQARNSTTSFPPPSSIFTYTVDFPYHCSIPIPPTLLLPPNLYSYFLVSLTVPSPKLHTLSVHGKEATEGMAAAAVVLVPPSHLQCCAAKTGQEHHQWHSPSMTFTTNDIPSFSSCLQCCPWRGSEGGNGSFPALAVAIMRLSAGFSPTPAALPSALQHIEVLLRRAVVGQAVSVTVLHKYRQIFSVEGASPGLEGKYPFWPQSADLSIHRWWSRWLLDVLVLSSRHFTDYM